MERVSWLVLVWLVSRFCMACDEFESSKKHHGLKPVPKHSVGLLFGFLQGLWKALLKENSRLTKRYLNRGYLLCCFFNFCCTFIF